MRVVDLDLFARASVRRSVETGQLEKGSSLATLAFSRIGTIVPETLSSFRTVRLE